MIIHKTHDWKFYSYLVCCIKKEKDFMRFKVTISFYTQNLLYSRDMFGFHKHRSRTNNKIISS